MLAVRSLLLIAGCCALLGCTALNNNFASRSTTRGTPINSAATTTMSGNNVNYAAAQPAAPPQSLSLSPPDALPPVAAAPLPPVVARRAPEKLYNLEPAEKPKASVAKHTTKVSVKESDAKASEEVLTPVAEKADTAAPDSHVANAEEMDAVLPVRKGSHSSSTSKNRTSGPSKSSPQSSLHRNVKTSRNADGGQIVPVSNPVQPEPLDSRFTS